MGRRQMHNTTSLPRDLRGELGIQDTYGDRKNRRSRNAAAQVSRKDRRRAERTEKRGHRGPMKGRNNRHAEEEEDDDEDLDDAFDMDDEEAEEEEVKKAPVKSKSTKSEEKKPKSEEKKSKSDSKKRKAESEPEDDDEDEPAPRKVSRAVKDKLEQDEAEIARLEKKLGLKKGKVPKSFAEDGLDDLLGDLGDGSEDESKQRKREADEWLLNKRRKAQGLKVDESEDEDEDDDESDEDAFDLDEDEDEDMLDEDGDLLGDDSEGDDDGEGSEFGGFDEEEKPEPKKRENPYVAPVPASANKYIPPSLRAASNTEDESLVRLRRQAQGHLNKLSEANMISILNEFEKLYREYPRQNVTSTLLTLLFGLICERSALNDTFIILHAGFIAALYKVVGMDFGAELIQKVVETLDAGGDERGPFQGKEAINLIALISQLYNFHVIGCTLVFDYIRMFLQEITEDNTELLLKIIRNSGPQLRQDDPSALKDIVLLIQPAVAKAGEASLSVRTKFMIDTITDLKNNKVKNNVNASISSEHITKMRKILGSLNNSRTLRASEPISISRTDIHNSAKKGKWWLVGASWKEDPLESARQELSGVPLSLQQQTAPEDDSEGEPDYASIAKAHRMNTDVRRSIFVAIMSATDYQDAHVRLMKLRLKRAQEYEIPRVLTHCAMEEEAYNPYYTLIARRLCGESGRRLKTSFMYTLWNSFKRMGERGEMDDEDDDGGFDEEDANSIQMKSIVNLAKFYAGLIADKTLSLGMLKTLNFAYLQPKTKTFVELLIISLIQASQKSKKGKKNKKAKKSEDDEGRDENAVIEIFMQTKDAPQVIKGLIYFVRKVVAKTDIVASEKEQKLVRWGCKVAVDALKIAAKAEGGLD